MSGRRNANRMARTPRLGFAPPGTATARGSFSPPMSSVRKVAGRPPRAVSTATASWNCSSSLGSSGRSRYKSSVRNRPTDSAPNSSALGTSEGASMLAESSIRTPSRLAAGPVTRDFRTCSRDRSRQAVADGLDVRTPLPQVWIFHPAERRRDRVDHPAHRPLGGDLVALDQTPGRAHDLVVREHHPMSFEEEMSLVQMFRFQPRRQQRELLVRRVHCPDKPCDFRRHEISRDLAFDDGYRRDQQVCRTDGNTIRGGCAAECPARGHGWRNTNLRDPFKQGDDPRALRRCTPEAIELRARNRRLRFLGDSRHAPLSAYTIPHCFNGRSEGGRMDTAQLRVRIEQAKRRLISAEQAMQTALQVVEPAARADKAMISNALRAALDELRSAKREVFDLESQIGPED